MSRREFLGLSFSALLTPAIALMELRETATQTVTYALDVKVLYGAYRLHLDGTLNATVNAAAGRYEVRAGGQGDGISNTLTSAGVLVRERWRPSETHSYFNVKGRESHSDVVFDWQRHTIDYHFRGETFLLRRPRRADDRLSVSESTRVDDALSALLNYREGKWAPESDGTFRTQVVRRRRPANEQPEDVVRDSGAELAPLAFTVAVDPRSGKRTARVDLTTFSSWATSDRPAVVTFGNDAYPEQIAMEMILGTSAHLAIADAGYARTSAEPAPVR